VRRPLRQGIKNVIPTERVDEIRDNVARDVWANSWLERPTGYVPGFLRVNQSLALGYVPAALAKADAGFEIEIIGERHKAHRLTAAAFDPSGKLMRA